MANSCQVPAKPQCNEIAEKRFLQGVNATATLHLLMTA